MKLTEYNGQEYRRLSSWDNVQTPLIGERYHCSWQKGIEASFVLISINDGLCFLKASTPRNGVKCKVSELRHTKRSAIKANFELRQRIASLK